MSGDNYRFKVGDFECTIISDGTFAYPHPAQLLFFNAPPAQLTEVLREHDLDPVSWEQYVSPYPSLLINTGQNRVLVDVGAGAFAPTTGKLMANLKAAGIAPEEIDTVILTHGHIDHIGGTIDDQGKSAFPNARYIMWKSEWDFWISEPDLSPLPIPDHLKDVLVETAKKTLPPISGQLDLIEAETEIVPGIRAIAAPGHTPGHMALAISSGGEQLLDIIDTVIHPIQIEQPTWVAAFDLLHDQTIATRYRLLDRAATERCLVRVYHFPAPGLGYVTRKEEGWQWDPLEL
jgi:glyoxylase-like metal-dependent hydrolase (beta-lactamase superfamily II)